MARRARRAPVSPRRGRPAGGEPLAAPLRVEPPPEDPAETYHAESKYAPHTLPRLLAAYAAYERWREAQPFPLAPRKVYPAAPFAPLPRPARLWAPLGRVLARRASTRPAGPIAARDLATLLHAAAGVRADGRRHAPSAGGLYPLEAYVATPRVEGVAPALHHYDAARHGLARLAEGAEVARWFLDGDLTARAGAVVVLAAVMPRLTVKYGERGYRFALLEAGHAAQNLLLAAAARGVAALPVGAYYDDRVHDALGLDGVSEIALYTLLVGAAEP